MPYLVVGKCVYKKKADGSRGAKVGCTKGSVKDYLAALHMHTGHSTKRGKGRKIKYGKGCKVVKHGKAFYKRQHKKSRRKA